MRVAGNKNSRFFLKGEKKEKKKVQFIKLPSRTNEEVGKDLLLIKMST